MKKYKKTLKKVLTVWELCCIVINCAEEISAKLNLRSTRNGRIAQLGEHLPYKQGVIGSSPITPTIFDLIHRTESILARSGSSVG